MFRFNKTIIREPTVCVSLKLQYWRQLKYFVIELFGRVANVKIYIMIYSKCSYMSRFNQTINRKPTVCALLKLQYWCQLTFRHRSFTFKF
jgi:hypothetical protein